MYEKGSLLIGCQWLVGGIDIDRIQDFKFYLSWLPRLKLLTLPIPMTVPTSQLTYRKVGTMAGFLNVVIYDVYPDGLFLHDLRLAFYASEAVCLSA